MTKKLIYTGQFKPHLLADELQAALAWSPVTTEGTSRLHSIPGEVRIFADDDTDEAAVAAVVAAHDPAALTKGEQNDAHTADVNLRLKANALAGKSPQEIYQIAQARIDGWSSLAAAKADMREWFPLMFAAVFWLVRQERD